MSLFKERLHKNFYDFKKLLHSKQIRIAVFIHYGENTKAVLTIRVLQFII